MKERTTTPLSFCSVCDTTTKLPVVDDLANGGQTMAYLSTVTCLSTMADLSTMTYSYLRTTAKMSMMAWLGVHVYDDVYLSRQSSDGAVPLLSNIFVEAEIMGGHFVFSSNINLINSCAFLTENVTA